jgi:hypothetical protein
VPVSLWPSVIEAFPRVTRRLEGDFPHLYLDVDGWVTIAWGVLADPIELALPMPFMCSDGTKANHDQIAAEWADIKGRKELAHLGAREAEKHCLLHLTPAGVLSVVQGRLDATIAALARQHHDLARYPADGQFGMILEAWATGTGTVERPAYPRRDEAIRRGDWLTAADECRIRGNTKRTEAVLACFVEAHESVRLGADPSLLRYRG